MAPVGRVLARIRRYLFAPAIATFVALACVRPAPRHEPADLSTGAALYQRHCAVCHGPEGLGNGPSVARLGVVPPDLTMLSRRNGGAYPFDLVNELVGGRVPLRGHGGAEMPIWADAFLDAQDGYDARSARRRIEQITHYLATLQTAEQR
jgi:mono/diheme cytochrome c family protein